MNWSFNGWSISEFQESIERLLNDNEDLFIITSGGNKVFTSWGNFTNQLWSIAGLLPSAGFRETSRRCAIDPSDGAGCRGDCRV